MSSTLVDADGILVSEAAAKAVFDELRSDPGFLWEYVDDCCLARAHKMCALLKRKGIFSEKIRADNADGTWLGSFGLAIRRKDAPGEYIIITFHIAPVVKVRTPGGIEERILDPALFDAPVARHEWAKQLINANSIRPDNTIDATLQDKSYMRMAWDVFETVLFWSNKDESMALTNKLLAKHRANYEKMLERAKEKGGVRPAAPLPATESAPSSPVAASGQPG